MFESSDSDSEVESLNNGQIKTTQEINREEDKEAQAKNDSDTETESEFDI